MAKQPMLAIPLDLPGVRVLQTELTKQHELIITVESTLTSTNCQRCGQPIALLHDHDDPIMLRHLSILVCEAHQGYDRKRNTAQQIGCSCIHFIPLLPSTTKGRIVS